MQQKLPFCLLKSIWIDKGHKCHPFLYHMVVSEPSILWLVLEIFYLHIESYGCIWNGPLLCLEKKGAVFYWIARSNVNEQKRGCVFESRKIDREWVRLIWKCTWGQGKIEYPFNLKAIRTFQALLGILRLVSKNARVIAEKCSH